MFSTQSRSEHKVTGAGLARRSLWIGRDKWPINYGNLPINFVPIVYIAHLWEYIFESIVTGGQETDKFSFR